MNIFLGELIGTTLLVLLGNGVVANVMLADSKGKNSGWIVIAAGWAFAVAVALYVVGWVSGGHLNPAITLAFAAFGNTSWSLVPLYLLGQFLGGMIGSVMVWLAYYPHWEKTGDPRHIFLCFATRPAIRKLGWNCVCEFIGTAVLVLGVLGIFNANNGVASGVGPYMVGILIFSIGLSLGGPTGYAINPVRDFAPRLTHYLLPIVGKGSSDWDYAWVPIIGPIAGGLFGAWIYGAIIANMMPL